MASSTRPSRSASPSTRRPPPRRPAADVGSVVTHAVGTALLAATIGLAIAVICSVSAWALAPHGDGGGADSSVRLAVMSWLLAHHVPIDVPGGMLTLTPLGLMLVPLGLCYASGRQLARVLHPTDLGAVGRATGLFALTYGVVAAIVAGVSGGDGLRPHPLAALLAASVIGLLAAGFGMLRAAGLWAELVDAVPPVARQVLGGAVAAVAAWVGIAAFLLGLLLTVAFPEALEITRAYDADVLGAVLLAVLGITLLPNLVLWLVSFTTGVGFRLGVDSPVTPQAVEYGPLPVLPPLAAVPPEGQLPAWAMAVLVVPLAAGAVAGVVVHRRAQRSGMGPAPEQVAGIAALGGLVAGGLLGLLAWLAAGSAGGQRLAEVGPVGWQVGLVAAVELAVVAAVTAWECGRRGWDGQIPWPRSTPDWLRRPAD